MESKSIETIQREHLAWATYNFGERRPDDPHLGMIEEVGELAHAMLKRRQGIRGNAEQHDAKAKDAIGDISIYMIDFCNLTGIDVELMHTEALEMPRRSYSDQESILRIQVAMGIMAARVIDESYRGTDLRYDIRNILRGMLDLCLCRQWDFSAILNETWEDVGKRDWKKFPGDGISKMAGQPK